jgi:glycosyltransferase involved in cell wall biosynthesis
LKAVLVCHQVPAPVGHGGHRRAYQIRRDLEDALGADNVQVADNLWNHYPGPGLRNLPFRVRRTVSPFLENPLKLVARTRFASTLYSLPPFHSYYEALLDGIRGPAVSIIEHAAFSALLPINARHGVPTVACTQNLEALDMSDDMRGKWAMRAKALDLANEFEVLARCDHRLYISRVEAGLMGGLGLSGSFYPYLPVGEIKRRLEGVRQARARGPIERGLFLLLGTVGPVIRRTSFVRFLENARRGLPKDVRLVVAGLYTETLFPPGESLAGIDVRGWLEDDALDALLARVAGVVVPHHQGFGALTRVPELSCAGVPVLVSRNATFAQDPPPGVAIVEDAWDAWCAAMESMSRADRVVAAAEYEAWEAGQPRPLPGVLKALATGR